MNDFEYDAYIKKRIARGYQNKKNGSKSKKCFLPSDRMTQKEWKEKNGDIMSYQLNKPMEWREFKSMPVDLQKTYIESLRDRYGTTATDLSKFLHVTPATVTKYCKDNLGVAFSAGKRMTKHQRELLSEFLGEENEPAENAESCDGFQETRVADEVRDDRSCEQQHDALVQNCSTNTYVAPKCDTTIDFLTTPGRFDMKEISMCFTGGFDPDALRNSLLLSIGKGTPVRISIDCTLLV